ncbi:methylitaconate delta2-delta3-isomerase [Limnohabitans sp. 2KL-1]|uniref:4-oxalomesaconate tautomerase n=1 Tax=Limnohabitans sp. 2KL-1 TaxID=1100699 RepID=UPI000D3C0841|nr:4-oxalomesaconate tautomerase [Limnohabitans sp. 2KL-1]PUE46480.1 methylitaconate delta2-delta3-isomerase [Limnohabitans sp. 2KL-1]
MFSLNRKIPCVLMRAGTSRGPFFLKEWLPSDPAERDQALIGAIGASDPLQLDGLGGNSTLNSKVAIVSRSSQPDCDLDYLFAQVGVGHQSVDTRPNCGNMLSGVAPFAIEQGLINAHDGVTTVRIYNVNTGAKIDATVQTPGGYVTYEGTARIDGVAGTAAPILLNFLDAWGAVTGQLFPTGNRTEKIQGVEVTCIDAAMPLMILRASDLGLSGRERPVELDANGHLLKKIEAMRLEAGHRMGLGDVSDSVVPKPVIVSMGDGVDSIVSRYFTPHRCHASHAVTGAIGVSTAFALPGTVASGVLRSAGRHLLSVVHPQGQIDIDVELVGEGEQALVSKAALVRTARKIMQGELHLPHYVFPSEPGDSSRPGSANYPSEEITIIVPTSAGGGNDNMARVLSRKLGPELGQSIAVDNRAGANGSVAAEYVCAARSDGYTLMFGYIATHGINPVMQQVRYDPLKDFAPIGLIGHSPSVLVVHAGSGLRTVGDFLKKIRQHPQRMNYASAGEGTVPHLAAEILLHQNGVVAEGVTHAGAAPAINAVVRGQAQWMVPSLFSALPYLKTGNLVALAVAGKQRLSWWPDVPTFDELDLQALDLTQWYGLFAPASTEPAVVSILNLTLNKVLSDVETVGRLLEDGVQVRTSSPDELHQHVQAELARWAGIISTFHVADVAESSI